MASYFYNSTLSAIQVQGRLSLKDLSEIQEIKVNSFLISLDSSRFTFNQHLLEQIISAEITHVISIKDLQLEVLTKKIIGATKLLIKATVPTLEDQLKDLLSQIYLRDKTYEQLAGKGELLKEPFTKKTIAEKYPNIGKEDIPFSYLVEVPYSALKGNEPYYIPDLLKNSIANEDIATVDVLNDQPVGFNPVTDSVIVLIKGSFKE